MRKGIKKELAKLYPVVNVGNSITVKPCLMLKFGSEIKTLLGRYNVFSVVCIASPGAVDTLDTMHEAVQKALHKKPIKRVLDSTVFYPEYTGAGNDFPDDVLKASTKEVNFRIPAFGNDVM